MTASDARSMVALATFWRLRYAKDHLVCSDRPDSVEDAKRYALAVNACTEISEAWADEYRFLCNVEAMEGQQ